MTEEKRKCAHCGSGACERPWTTPTAEEIIEVKAKIVELFLREKVNPLLAMASLAEMSFEFAERFGRVVMVSPPTTELN